MLSGSSTYEGKMCDYRARFTNSHWRSSASIEAWGLGLKWQQQGVLVYTSIRPIKLIVTLTLISNNKVYTKPDSTFWCILCFSNSN
ncbi:hypothetical protein [Microcoleus sp. Z1_C4]|uniref:hypothetical protein n=1 Tax=Microcoleus sp. Z1_C4 TaxID=3055432 RepID=UPI002FD6F71A